jgi:flagellar hook assembly protein FlgD/outer membrane protein OmpA-like peptidoglycan-associated protein
LIPDSNGDIIEGNGRRMMNVNILGNGRRAGSKQLVVLVFLGFCLAAAPASAETGFYDFLSPTFMAGSANSVSLESPAATLLNPAVAGGKQRITLDLSYIGLMDFSPAFLWDGHIVNLGITLPTRVGVFSAVGRFATAEFPNLDWGTLGGLHLSFAKDLFEDFYIGIGLGAELGPDWGLWGDLGFLNLPGDIGFMKNFRWGVALRGLGKGYQPDDASTEPGGLAWPPMFTPAIAASFSLVDKDPFLLTVSGDLSFPTFQDIRLQLGTEFSAADLVFLNLYWNADLRQMLTPPAGDPARALPLGFGLSLKIRTNLPTKVETADSTERGWNQSEMKVTASAMGMQDGIWAFGLGANMPIGVIDRTPPAIVLDTEGEKYVSPNFDGVKDDLTLPLAINDQRYVKGYRFVVIDVAGKTVATILNKEDRTETRDIGNLWKRLVYAKSGIPIPESIRWDGTSDAGTVVPDGTYTYVVEAWDDNGNTGTSATGTVVVDNTPPSITLSTPYLIFSPNGDGNKDTLDVQQNGSVEDRWTGVFADVAGTPVASFAWDKQTLAPWAWNGKNEQGTRVPDGVYSYRVTATDRAGNGASAQIDNVIVDTQETPIQLTIDQSFFSPNGDGVKDTVTFGFKVPVLTGIERWQLVITDANKAARRTISGTLSIPASAVWDGKDDAGALLPEGAYVTDLAIFYVNGNNPKAQSPAITIDVTAPSAAAKADEAVFSPNGDGSKDAVTFFQETSDELFWTGSLKDGTGREVRSFVWRGRADDRFNWDGRDAEGKLLADGAYTYALSSTDRAGNTVTSTSVGVRIDTEATPVIVATDVAVFSPNGDGVKDRIRFLPNLRVTAGVDAWSFRVRDEAGGTVRTFTGRNAAPGEVSWDGIDDAGKKAKDGRYAVELEVTYANGNKPKVISNQFRIDTTFPEITVSADALLFSPDGDGRLDAIAVKQASGEEDLWEGEIRNAKAERVRGFFWKGKAADFTWDGKDDNGNRVPDGFYSYVVKTTRQSGNATAKELRGIQVDTRATPIYATASAAGFSPNGDGLKDDLSFTLLATVKEGIKSWKLSIVHPTAGSQKEFGGTGALPASVTWDGKVGYQTAPEGTYTAVFSVEYAKGNLPEARTTAFRLDVSGPKVELTAAPLPFSPDNDGVSDELTIALKVDEASPIESWELVILDPLAHHFNRVSGKGAPTERIIWDGTSDTGELVQSAEDYTLNFTIRDELGNTGTATAKVPIDILVIRDGDRLKVRIPSITFAPNTPDYIKVDPDKALKNEEVIKRLAEIFKKFGKYKILIVGHANRDKYDPAVNAAGAAKEQNEELLPLSKARADAIRTALIAEGIEARRITTEGKGGAEPVVAFNDRDNWWKNRRVEFILVRE